MPKEKSGNTNDGNTARRFFSNAEVTSDITGINLCLLKRLFTILSCLGCEFQINAEAFEVYVRDTRDLYLREYEWYNMPVSLHKILFHSRHIISSCMVPIGQLSEEAQESRNKDVRNYREWYTMKSSRTQTNEDLLHRLLISSDPYICSLRKPSKTKRGTLPQDVIALLAQEEVL